jgi:hypothetical protein
LGEISDLGSSVFVPKVPLFETEVVNETGITAVPGENLLLF